MSIAIQQLTFVLAPYLRDTVGFDGTVQEGDQVCYPCYKFLNNKLRSSKCMLSSEDIVLKLKSKQLELEEKLSEFQCTTPESCVNFCLYKTAISACELLASNRSFLFPNMYRLFMDYIVDEEIDLTDVCVSKSRQRRVMT